MRTGSITIRPKTVDEIEQELRDWWGRDRRNLDLASYIRFSRPSGSKNRLRMSSQLKNNELFQLNKNELFCQFAGRRVHLFLDDFEVTTGIEGRTSYFDFRLSELVERHLKDKLSTMEKTKHPVFVSRMLNALKELADGLPTEQIDAASAEPTDFMVLYKALTAPSVATQLAAEDPLAAARLRGVERHRDLLAKSGGVLSGQNAADLLGISRQALDKRRSQGRVIGLTQGRRGYAYPAWQFEGGTTLTGLEKVLAQLRDHDPWMQLTFFLNANDRLNGDSPLELLRSGKVEPILEAAASYGQQGAS